MCEVATNFFSELETYQKQIREFADMTLHDYKEDWKTQRVVERTLQMMIVSEFEFKNKLSLFLMRVRKEGIVLWSRE